jgi:hypothetical protein
VVTISRIRRPDFTNSLVHLTRERKEYKQADEADEFSPQELVRTVSAFDVLKEILASGVIHGSGNEGYVKGNRCAACFSEIPLSTMHQFAKPSSEKNAKYRFYGVALSKTSMFDLGGRPVIYLPDAEAAWIPEEERWRHVRYEHGRVDFTHEREWRMPGDLDLRTVHRGLYVIVWSAAEARELEKFSAPWRDKIRGILPMEDLGFFL